MLVGAGPALTPVALSFIAFSIRRDPWRALLIPTLVAIAAVATILSIAFANTRPIGAPMYPYAGLLQRLYAFSWFAWTILVARHLARGSTASILMRA